MPTPKEESGREEGRRKGGGSGRGQEGGRRRGNERDGMSTGAAASPDERLNNHTQHTARHDSTRCRAGGQRANNLPRQFTSRHMKEQGREGGARARETGASKRGESKPAGRRPRRECQAFPHSHSPQKQGATTAAATRHAAGSSSWEAGSAAAAPHALPRRHPAFSSADSSTRHATYPSSPPLSSTGWRALTLSAPGMCSRRSSKAWALCVAYRYL